MKRIKTTLLAIAIISRIPTYAQEPSYVDLGLSVKWATCNLGAASPEAPGAYFAWGETLTKSTYSLSTYKWQNKSSGDSFYNMTKYVPQDSESGQRDGLKVITLNDDAAYQMRGDRWRMPTSDEFEELRTKCKWTLTTINGKKGYKIESLNGNYIFLPVTGYSENTGVNGYYWSSTLADNEDSPRNAYFLRLSDSRAFMSHQRRHLGMAIRPVYDSQITPGKAPSSEANATSTVTCTQTDPDDEPIPFLLVNQKPTFQGAAANTFSLWINTKLVYPPAAREEDIEGQVIVQFIVNKDGSVSNVKVLRGVHPELDYEAVRVISQSPIWEPGVHEGKPVRVWITQKVIFKLTD